MRQRVYTFTESALLKMTQLSKPAQQVYVQLLCLRSYKTSCARVTQRRLSTRLGFKSDTSIQKALKELRDVGWVFTYKNVDYTKPIRGGICQVFNVYRVTNLKDGVIN